MDKKIKRRVVGGCLCSIFICILFLWIKPAERQSNPERPASGVVFSEKEVAPSAKSMPDVVDLREEEMDQYCQPTNQHVYEKDRVSVGEYILDIRYVEYDPPALFRKFEPLSGERPVWIKAAETVAEFYKYDYEDILNSMSQELIRMVGNTRESHNFRKQQFLDGAYKHPELIERSLLSEMFVTVDGHEFVVVGWDEYAWRKSIDDKASNGVTKTFYEKEDGLWKSALNQPWYFALPRSRSELKELLEGDE